MGYSAYFESGYIGDAASIKGWGDFGRWVNSLDADHYPTLAHLSAYGWTGHLDALQDELADALTDSPPEASVASTAKNLLSLLDEKKAEDESLFVSDGVA